RVERHMAARWDLCSCRNARTIDSECRDSAKRREHSSPAWSEAECWVAPASKAPSPKGRQPSPERESVSSREGLLSVLAIRCAIAFRCEVTPSGALSGAVPSLRDSHPRTTPHPAFRCAPCWARLSPPLRGVSAFPIDTRRKLVEFLAVLDLFEASAAVLSSG